MECAASSSRGVPLLLCLNWDEIRSTVISILSMPSAPSMEAAECEAAGHQSPKDGRMTGLKQTQTGSHCCTEHYLRTVTPDGCTHDILSQSPSMWTLEGTSVPQVSVSLAAALRRRIPRGSHDHEQLRVSVGLTGHSSATNLHIHGIPRWS